MTTNERSESGGGGELRTVDCLIVGGGAAGLSAAVNMARMRRSVLLVDERDRLIWGHRIDNYLGFPDGLPALDLRRLGWRHAARFGVELLFGHVSRAQRDGDCFRLRIDYLPENGLPGRPAPTVPRDAEMARYFGEVPNGGPMDVVARCVIVATGVVGHFPDFPGRDQCVGKSLYWCIHCDGFESIDRKVGVVGDDEEAVQTALDLLDFTSDVRIVAGRAEGFSVPASRLADLAANGIAAYPAAVAEYRHVRGEMQALVLADTEHTEVPLEQVYTVRHTKPINDIARQLGLDLESNGHVRVNTNQETNVPGVYAAGDITSPHDHQMSAAVHEGNQAACAANYFLYRPVQREPAGAE
jgi:thioredoxin reductase (NADPH)